jgi:8-oxo-dGTP pyrophosphatase MutT (NUDIX family)
MVMARLVLKELVERLVPADAIEREHRAAILALIERPGDITSRASYVPGHLTASAFVISPDDSRLLLIHHGKLNRWLQPGGHLEPSDLTMEAAARREALEETGARELELIAAPFDVDVHEIPARATEPAHRHFDVRFLFRASSEAIVSGSDAVAARWVSLDEVETLESDESVLRAVRKMRSQRVVFQ